MQFKTSPDNTESPARTFSGYASLFALTDLSGDIIEPGAFSASLKRYANIPMLWQHQADNPIGVWVKITLDQHGLYVEGQLAQGVKRADEAWQLMTAGALDGLSIGFRTMRSKKTAGNRHILEADLWEISLVTFPMMPHARVNRLNKAAQINAAQHLKNHTAISAARIIRHAAARLRLST
ncbi:HK97 family phage prohead protease [Pseudochrobactrum sp. MP213Fo]|uniref:HK97 family phage prohead protease n=1 Tax=Pseudochrobactrum sp. MP213Fo TaxID=3022250 RepID=UPI003B9F178E